MRAAAAQQQRHRRKKWRAEGWHGCLPSWRTLGYTRTFCLPAPPLHLLGVVGTGRTGQAHTRRRVRASIKQGHSFWCCPPPLTGLSEAGMPPSASSSFSPGLTRAPPHESSWQLKRHTPEEVGSSVHAYRWPCDPTRNEGRASRSLLSALSPTVWYLQQPRPCPGGLMASVSSCAPAC